MVAAHGHHMKRHDTRENVTSKSLKVVQVTDPVTTVYNERTLLVAKPEEEEVYPLPWFRSPDWTKHVPLATRNSTRPHLEDERKRISVCPATLPCCYNSTASDGDSESDMELGYLIRRPVNAHDEENETDSFKQCIQFLVGLIVLMAMALVLLIIFKQQPDDLR
ncbi:unnamed protein product [Peronospora farinosa]|uniref:Uncharacterized protein n=1 Tax=Peronospora farinosa TaxID=134698 RepID=A0AAV0T9U0_9STRA|nr:unnamed protein product [Peronospora farinosa]CAI5715635.1 unnamed protein product [Peronospora farinosa]